MLLAKRLLNENKREYRKERKKRKEKEGGIFKTAGIHFQNNWGS